MAYKDLGSQLVCTYSSNGTHYAYIGGRSNTDGNHNLNNGQYDSYTMCYFDVTDPGSIEIINIYSESDINARAYRYDDGTNNTQNAHRWYNYNGWGIIVYYDVGASLTNSHPIDYHRSELSAVAYGSAKTGYVENWGGVGIPYNNPGANTTKYLGVRNVTAGNTNSYTSYAYNNTSIDNQGTCYAGDTVSYYLGYSRTYRGTNAAMYAYGGLQLPGSTTLAYNVHYATGTFTAWNWATHVITAANAASAGQIFGVFLEMNLFLSSATGSRSSYYTYRRLSIAQIPQWDVTVSKNSQSLRAYRGYPITVTLSNFTLTTNGYHITFGSPSVYTIANAVAARPNFANGTANRTLSNLNVLHCILPNALPTGVAEASYRSLQYVTPNNTSLSALWLQKESKQTLTWVDPASTGWTPPEISDLEFISPTKTYPTSFATMNFVMQATVTNSSAYNNLSFDWLIEMSTDNATWTNISGTTQTSFYTLSSGSITSSSNSDKWVVGQPDSYIFLNVPLYTTGNYYKITCVPRATEPGYGVQYGMPVSITKRVYRIQLPTMPTARYITAILPPIKGLLNTWHTRFRSATSWGNYDSDANFGSIARVNQTDAIYQYLLYQEAFGVNLNVDKQFNFTPPLSGLTAIYYDMKQSIELSDWTDTEFTTAVSNRCNMPMLNQKPYLLPTAGITTSMLTTLARNIPFSLALPSMVINGNSLLNSGNIWVDGFQTANFNGLIYSTTDIVGWNTLFVSPADSGGANTTCTTITGDVTVKFDLKTWYTDTLVRGLHSIYVNVEILTYFDSSGVRGLIRNIDANYPNLFNNQSSWTIVQPANTEVVPRGTGGLDSQALPIGYPCKWICHNLIGQTTDAIWSADTQFDTKTGMLNARQIRLGSDIYYSVVNISGSTEANIWSADTQFATVGGKENTRQLKLGYDLGYKLTNLWKQPADSVWSGTTVRSISGGSTWLDLDVGQPARMISSLPTTAWLRNYFIAVRVSTTGVPIKIYDETHVLMTTLTTGDGDILYGCSMITHQFTAMTFEADSPVNITDIMIIDLTSDTGDGTTSANDAIKTADADALWDDVGFFIGSKDTTTFVKGYTTATMTSGYPTFTFGNTYYIACEVSDMNAGVHVFDSGNNLMFSITSGSSGHLYTQWVSHLSYSDELLFRSDAGESVDVDGLVIIDVSARFNAGYVPAPTDAQLFAQGYFTGTKTTNIVKDYTAGYMTSNYPSFVSGRKYFVMMETSDAINPIYLRTSTEVLLCKLTSGDAGKYYGLFTPTSNYNNTLVIESEEGTWSTVNAGYKCSVDGLSVIDMTYCFTAGNEPIVSNLYTDVGYFTGSKTSNLNVIKWTYARNTTGATAPFVVGRRLEVSWQDRATGGTPTLRLYDGVNALKHSTVPTSSYGVSAWAEIVAGTTNQTMVFSTAVDGQPFDSAPTGMALVNGMSMIDFDFILSTLNSQIYNEAGATVNYTPPTQQDILSGYTYTNGTTNFGTTYHVEYPLPVQHTLFGSTGIVQSNVLNVEIGDYPLTPIVSRTPSYWYTGASRTFNFTIAPDDWGCTDTSYNAHIYKYVVYDNNDKYVTMGSLAKTATSWVYTRTWVDADVGTWKVKFLQQSVLGHSNQDSANNLLGLTTYAGDWESGQYSDTTGAKVAATGRIRLVDLIPVQLNSIYYINVYTDKDLQVTIREYRANGTFLRNYGPVVNGSIVKFGANTERISITMYSPGNASYSNYESDFANGLVRPWIGIVDTERDFSNPFWETVYFDILGAVEPAPSIIKAVDQYIALDGWTNIFHIDLGITTYTLDPAFPLGNSVGSYVFDSAASANRYKLEIVELDNPDVVITILRGWTNFTKEQNYQISQTFNLLAYIDGTYAVKTTYERVFTTKTVTQMQLDQIIPPNIAFEDKSTWEWVGTLDAEFNFCIWANVIGWTGTFATGNGCWMEYSRDYGVTWTRVYDAPASTVYKIPASYLEEIWVRAYGKNPIDEQWSETWINEDGVPEGIWKHEAPYDYLAWISWSQGNQDPTPSLPEDFVRRIHISHNGGVNSKLKQISLE